MIITLIILSLIINDIITTLILLIIIESLLLFYLLLPHVHPLHMTNETSSLEQSPRTHLHCFLLAINSLKRKVFIELSKPVGLLWQ